MAENNHKNIILSIDTTSQDLYLAINYAQFWAKNLKYYVTWKSSLALSNLAALLNLTLRTLNLALAVLKKKRPMIGKCSFCLRYHCAHSEDKDKAHTHTHTPSLHQQCKQPARRYLLNYFRTVYAISNISAVYVFLLLWTRKFKNETSWPSGLLLRACC